MAVTTDLSSFLVVEIDVYCLCLLTDLNLCCDDIVSRCTYLFAIIGVTLHSLGVFNVPDY